MSRYENERDDDHYERDDDRYERENDDRYEYNDDRYSDRDDSRYVATTNATASPARYAEIDDDYDGQAFRLYMAALDRTPDPTGLANWTNLLRSGADLDDVANGFVTSTEFQSRYGDLDNSEYVTQLYQNVLNRTPDASGFSNWVGQLESGETRESVLIGFSESTENRLQAAALVNGIDYQAWVG